MSYLCLSDSVREEQYGAVPPLVLYIIIVSKENQRKI